MAEPDIDGRVPDVTNLTVDELLVLLDDNPDGPLAALIRTLLAEADQPQDVVAGFQSAI